MPRPWFRDRLLSQLPAMYVPALSATLRVTAIAFAVALAAGI
ncbi:hypothetical protein [Streptosporangium sp. KLBMP 9127]